MGNCLPGMVINFMHFETELTELYRNFPEVPVPTKTLDNGTKNMVLYIHALTLRISVPLVPLVIVAKFQR